VPTSKGERRKGMGIRKEGDGTKDGKMERERREGAEGSPCMRSHE